MYFTQKNYDRKAAVRKPYFRQTTAPSEMVKSDGRYEIDKQKIMIYIYSMLDFTSQ